jgi:uncharacterized protein (DUF1684 family)
VTDLYDPVRVTELLDWKRQIFQLYADVRSEHDRQKAWRRWRSARDEMFRSHPQSPLPSEARPRLRGLHYYDYSSSARVLAELRPADPTHFDIPTSSPDTMSFTRFATARFELDGHPLDLELYWLDGYGGGLFLPFRDATAGRETYGAGRYLLDTVKGSDLGVEEGRLVLDFNFAYNPSCAYDPRWVCPLAPPSNRLDVSITAGERNPPGAMEGPNPGPSG